MTKRFYFFFEWTLKILDNFTVIVIFLFVVFIPLGSTISSLRLGPKSVDLRQGSLQIILKFRKGAQKKGIFNYFIILLLFASLSR